MVLHETSAPYTPQQNGIAERKNRTLKEMMNAMLLSSGLPENMWGEAVQSACYILNRVPHKKLDKTPYEMWKGFSPNLSYLKAWGCLAKVAYPEFKKSNIGPKTFDCVFIGYAQNSAAYRFMCLKDSSICESRDAEFFEQEFPLIDSHNSHKVSYPSSTPMIPSTTELRRSKRQKIENSFGPDFLTIFLAEDIDRIDDHVVSAFFVDEDPKTYIEAITSIDSSFWKEAIKNELDSILENHTWDLVDLPRGSKPIKCKWVFKKKIRPDGSIDKFKARLVVVGYTQRKGIDYFDTYSPVTKIATIRTLIALSAIYGLIHQMDVKTAFLNGDLNEEIYMEQPEGFAFPGQEGKVCQEAEWLRNLVGDMPMWGSSVPVSIHCDSQAAIGIAKNYAYNGKRRHIRIRHGAVKELLKNGIISLEYVRSERNLADPLTKGLTRRIILETSRAMGLNPQD
ncbi:UNVERIFIED_CONTAM: Retrovirus-related Pol polyprotein from transposon TNT 1-94 [Sesamum angustifolium]|uniref:Retrovirus-related Pol polyprotein from transposon TNT 1-94 n=1 Tax=Sesamum angustifolium TaxID=2727405 RepID=A0AAW2LVK0_9LAMI